MSDMESLRMDLLMFEAINGRVPTHEEGLQAVVKNPDPERLKHWRAWRAELPKDPWGHNYQYVVAAPGGDQPFGIYSFGPDGVSRSGGNDPDDRNTWGRQQLQQESVGRVMTWAGVAAAVVGMLSICVRFVVRHRQFRSSSFHSAE